ncbi:prepilin-type N-terminal cleavage/methylation domain-containing protein [Hypnocyclicus thermotrophus]|uniref:Prepilin-type N-terminal cleavage/methylation domain-containing protein n=1 Tax=Hypnocyclicus thermotrophus TaxID=1627895 RepID=A0AA46I5V1_9FUSO|nr:prepilin-type N-terminal cleavage/methylation domain-containing protein [Hypnocyclicus thermotrophus]TDT69792.1 prepilin-type N-terminal cleavage/methylation domain-containing protein [Hypnocyclicus thermotrophus]
MKRENCLNENNIKKNGFSLVELILAIAITTIILSLIIPFTLSFSKNHKRQEEINNMDLEMSKTVDIIKKVVRSSQNYNGNKAIITPIEGTTSSALVLTTTVLNSSGIYIPYWVKFEIVGNELKVGESDTSSSSIVASDTILSNVEDGYFLYDKNVVVIYLKLKNGDYTRTIRDSAVTRIDFNF